MRKRTKLIALNAISLALMTVFTFVSIPTVGAAIVPLVLLSVIISSIYGGWKNAVFSSVAMGVLSLIKNFTIPTLLSPAFQNPLISILPRLFIGVAVLGTYRLFKLFTRRMKSATGGDAVALTAAGVVGPVINTGLVFLMIWAVFGNSTIGDKNVTAWFLLLVTVNFPWEIGICSVLTAPILLALKRAMKVDYMRPFKKHRRARTNFEVIENADAKSVENVEIE